MNDIIWDIDLEEIEQQELTEEEKKLARECAEIEEEFEEAISLIQDEK